MPLPSIVGFRNPPVNTVDRKITKAYESTSFVNRCILLTKNLQYDSVHWIRDFPPDPETENEMSQQAEATEKRTSKQPLGFRPDDKLREALERAAASERRPVANMVKILVEDALIQRGFYTLPSSE